MGSEQMDSFSKAVELLPDYCRRQASELEGKTVEEFRLRLGQAPTALYNGAEHNICERQISAQDIWRCLEKATNASLHSASAALKSGYVSYRGLRVGVCGTATVKNGELAGFKAYSSVAVRIPRAHKGICDEIYKKLYYDGFKNTLIIAPPGGGKTTALRELIRLLSNEGVRCAVADERNELAASDMGQAQFDLGMHSDVLTGINKAQAAIMLLRGMNPQIVAMDEITRREDTEAIRELCGCGVGLIASAHAASLEDMRRRGLYRELLDGEIFERLLIINSRNGKRSYEVKCLCT